MIVYFTAVYLTKNLRVLVGHWEQNALVAEQMGKYGKLETCEGSIHWEVPRSL